MDHSLKAMCGAYCGICEWKEKTGCGGCQKSAAQMFWGECDKAKCCLEKGYEHCGMCPDVPCQKLLDLFADPKHGDAGARLRNIKGWANGQNTYEKLR